MPMRTASMSAPNLLGEVRELVHEADLGGEHRVGGVLGQLRRAHVHDDHPVAVARERLVKRPHHSAARGLVGADDHAIGFHEVLDRRALLQEFGVRYRVELDCRAALGKRCVTASRTLSAVPTGTVDLVITTLYSLMCGPIVRATASTYRRSAEPSSSGRSTHGDQLKQAMLHALPLRRW